MPTVYKIKIPKLGMAVDSATLTSWLVADGASVCAGDPLYIASTDKVDQEIISPASGVVKLIGTIDTNYAVGELIAEIVETS